MIAATRPTRVAAPSDGRWTCWIAWPPSSTWSPGERAASALEITRFTAAVGSSFARWSKFTVAKAMLPSFDTALAPAAAYGLVTPVTCGSLRFA